MYKEYVIEIVTKFYSQDFKFEVLNDNRNVNEASSDHANESGMKDETLWDDFFPYIFEQIEEKQKNLNCVSEK